MMAIAENCEIYISGKLLFNYISVATIRLH